MILLLPSNFRLLSTLDRNQVILLKVKFLLQETEDFNLFLYNLYLDISASCKK